MQRGFPPRPLGWYKPHVATATATQAETQPVDRSEHDQRDRALFDAWHAGDQRAGNVLVKHYFPRLRLYFIGRARGEHEDLVQDTFTRCLSKYAQSRQASFRAFLFGVARMVFLEFLRKRYRLQNIDPWTDSLQGIARSSMSSLLAQREDHRLLLDALAMLTLEDQDLLELYYWQRLPAAELGQIFGCGVPTVRSRIRAALKRLGVCFAQAAGRPHSTEMDEAQLEAWLAELRPLLERSKLRKQNR